jgi:membrane-associated phospholipid phosphatase
MQLGMARRAARPGPGPRPLLPGPLRWPAAALLAACAVLTAALAVRVAGYRLPEWLDATFDPRIQARLTPHARLLDWLSDLGTLKPVAMMALALALACAATRRWSGVLLTAAVPAASGLTEYVLKPTVGNAIGQSFPSGHATSMFALAAICAVLLAGPPRRRGPASLRLLLALAPALLAVAVSAAMIAMGAHDFTDAAAGAATGTGVVLAGALTLDLAAAWWQRARAARPPAAST